jgi:hypothetical protein
LTDVLNKNPEMPLMIKQAKVDVARKARNKNNTLKNNCCRFLPANSNSSRLKKVTYTIKTSDVSSKGVRCVNRLEKAKNAGLLILSGK